MNILLINSVPSFLAAVGNSVKKTKVKIFTTEGTENAVADIQKHNIHVAIINWSRGDFDIAALCRKVRKFKHSRYVYLMVVAARDRERDIPGFLEAGADDFIFKPFGKDELRARIVIAGRISRLEEEITRSKKKILRLAKEDPVTGLLNRRALLDEVLREMGRASREMKFMSVLMASLTNFKELADRHGMDVIDDVLDECGRRIKSSCRPYDKLGRYTMSDFILFVPDSGRGNAEKVARRIISSVVKKPLMAKGNKIALNLAIGISELDPKQINKNNTVDSNLMNDLMLDALTKKAEMAVKRAMRMGPNRIETFTE